MRCAVCDGVVEKEARIVDGTVVCGGCASLPKLEEPKGEGRSSMLVLPDEE